MTQRGRVLGFGAAGLLVLAGVVGAIVFSGTLGQVLALVLISLGCVLAAALGFLLTIFLTPWRKAFTMLDSDIKSLFPEEAYGAFKRLEVLTSPSKYGGLGLEGRQNVHDFVKARDAALRALYREVVPIR